MPLIWGERQCLRGATHWLDGQIAHGAHAQFARRAIEPGGPIPTFATHPECRFFANVGVSGLRPPELSGLLD